MISIGETKEAVNKRSKLEEYDRLLGKYTAYIECMLGDARQRMARVNTLSRK